MSAQHTPGKVHVSDAARGLVVYDEAGWAIADAKVFHARHSLEEAQANARRLAACWNACDGLSTEALERLGYVAAKRDMHPGGTL